MESESSIGRMLNRVRAELVEALDRELAPFEITSAQFVILGSLVWGDADSASALFNGASEMSPSRNLSD
jgi:hypothetical protein